MNQQTPCCETLQEATFLSVSFDIKDIEQWRQHLFVPANEGFEYVVTPNVDHVVRLSREPNIAPAYDGARWRICDSRVLNKLAQRRGYNLKPYPGSNIVSDLLHDPRARDLRIAIIGPSQADFNLLKARFPDVNIELIPAPIMSVGTSTWEETLKVTENTRADIYLICISFPKQEFFAHDLKKRGRVNGVGLCVGASIDFLTGQQKRAPKWMQNASLEWAYRLLSDPKRLWKRYLIEAPKVFALYLKDR